MPYARGKDYFKEKVCNEYNAFGERNFRSLSITINSRKYCNATFEQIISLVNDMVDLAKKCCTPGAAPDCYENEVNFSIRAGQSSLSQTRDRFMSTNRREYLFLAEYSSDYSYAPLPILLNSTRNYLSFVRTCCASTQRNICFLKERLQHKRVQAFAHLSNKACALHALLGENKTKVSYLIKFTQQTPSLPFENAMTLAGEASKILSKCCASLEENCIQNELKRHIAHICNTACSGNERIRTCCTSKDDVGKYLCIYSLPWAKRSEVPRSPSSIDEGVCREGGEIDVYRNIFDVARIYTRAPEALIITLYSASQAAATDCCDLLDVRSCFAERDSTIAPLQALIEKGNEICGEYADHTYVEFLKRLKANVLALLPAGTLETEDQVSSLLEQRIGYVTKCCHLNAPPIYCGIQDVLLNKEHNHTSNSAPDNSP
ncbi:vitamin D-binding protein [Protobothrops mucrosquamatus]|uniref:vitamin D-binding protein n=1 Tax=Protobothrops mucrosquamatus TaxID=103944 RepID=UPI0010FB3876|nr:vitamin D-binding protein [Protobothrops mucrosquamatus]